LQSEGKLETRNEGSGGSESFSKKKNNKGRRRGFYLIMF
jgi:hypothetical protein